MGLFKNIQEKLGGRAPQGLSFRRQVFRARKVKDPIFASGYRGPWVVRNVKIAGDVVSFRGESHNSRLSSEG